MADLRYAHQGVEIAVPLGEGTVDQALIDALVDRFHALHQELYTFADRKAAVEIVNLRVEARGLMDHAALLQIERASASRRPQHHATRRAALDGRDPVDVPVFRREELLCDHSIEGPAIIDQLDSTTVVLKGQSATVDRFGSLLIEERT